MTESELLDLLGELTLEWRTEAGRRRGRGSLDGEARGLEEAAQQLELLVGGWLGRRAEENQDRGLDSLLARLEALLGPAEAELVRESERLLRGEGDSSE